MPRSGSRRGKRSVEELGELNLSAIMAILVILIPMLIFVFNFFEVKVQAVAAPKVGSGKAKKKDSDKKPLNLTVLISRKGFVLKQQDELQTEPEKPIYKRTFEIDVEDEKGQKRRETVEDYDYPALYTRLFSKKTAYPDEKTINIAAEMDIPWHVVARTIDAARLQLDKPSYVKLSDYTAAKPATVTKKGADGKDEEQPKKMFDRVVFVVAE